MKADPASQQRLLGLASLDARLDRSAHRRRTMPELVELDRLARELADVDGDRVRVETEIGDIAREQRKLEQDVEQVVSRRTRDQQRLDSGAVGSSKELESLSSEVESLVRRQGVLEDQLLEVMERREEADSRLAEAAQRADGLTGQRADAERRRDETVTELDAENAAAGAERTTLLEQLPADVLALYDRLRAGSGHGVGAAALFRGRCEGCRQSLAVVDLGAVKAAADDEVQRCPECSRILVRTPDSGL